MSEMPLVIVSGVMPCSLVVGDLDLPATVGLLDRGLHRGALLVGVHQHPAFDVAGGAADRLDQRGGAAQEALLVGVEDRDQADLGEVEPLASRFTPTSTSNSPSRSSRMIWMRSSVSISECR